MARSRWRRSRYLKPRRAELYDPKLENDLNISLLDRSGHRAKFTDTGKMMLEKGRLLLNAANDLEKQAQLLSSGWERIWRLRWTTLFLSGPYCR